MRKFVDIPERIRRLPTDRRGFPVPAFVRWFDGEPDFRIIRSDHIKACVTKDRCWICGEPMGTHKVFVIGPMCVVNRISSEPPSHRSCAEFAAKNCPFLINPMAKRNERDLPEDRFTAGLMIDRNPGVVALWESRNWRMMQDSRGLLLFNVGDAVELDFYAEGRRATPIEVFKAINSGLPILAGMAREERDGAVDALLAAAIKASDVVTAWHLKYWPEEPFPS
jgi:hypothetical protein